ncbi:MAG: twitching motility protein PilU [Burkholderiaceae bacterium]|jgi:twitching motility protein PilU
MAMDRLFVLMKEKGASDMFLAVNSPIHLKINGKLVPINQQKMDNATIMTLLGEAVPASRLQELERDNELNIGIPVSGVGSFRLSAFRQRSSISAVLRYIPHTIPEIATLNVPPQLNDLIMAKRGLLLVVGSTGSGKSTTIASLLDYRNEHIAGHILTLEEPIEFLFRNKRSIVNQREVGVDTETLTVSLKNALRQAPDCIMIGEIRDRETMAAAMAYAQSGHLVVSTLHASNSYRALNRIIGFFPIENRPALLQDLASTVTAIVSQRLVPAIGGGLIPAVEVLLNTSHVADLIEDGEISQIHNAIEKSLSPGSQTFEQALLQLIRDGKVTQDDAIANADSASNLFWMINNTATGKPVSPDPELAVPDGPTFTEFTLDT